MASVLLREIHEELVAIKIDSDVQKLRDELFAQRKCLGCGKDIDVRERRRKGQCSACYQAALRNIKAKKVSARRLVREGKWMDEVRKGRPPTNAFTKYLAEL